MAFFEQIPDPIPGMIHGFIIDEGMEPPSLFEPADVMEQPQHPGQVLVLPKPPQLPGQCLTQDADGPGMALLAEDAGSIRIELRNIPVKSSRNRLFV